MIIGFFGIMSSGKGVLSTKFLRWRKQMLNKHIIANCFLNESNYTRLTSAELFEKTKNPAFFQNSYLYITELHNIIDARRSGSLLNTQFTQFLSQIGKLDCDIIYDSQLFESQIDVRMREFTPFRFLCQRWVMKEGKLQDARFEPRISEYPIFIKIYLDSTDVHGNQSIKKIGYYQPKKEDFDYYKTREIVTLDRDKFLSGRKR